MVRKFSYYTADLFFFVLRISFSVSDSYIWAKNLGQFYLFMNIMHVLTQQMFLSPYSMPIIVLDMRVSTEQKLQKFCPHGIFILFQEDRE